jgi:acetyltransferase-like isoleucine patch superfamily enzyme
MGEVGIFDQIREKGIWENAGVITFDGKCNIGHGFRISVSKCGNIFLGNNFNLTAKSTIVSHHFIKFGYNCLISWDCLIMDTDFHNITDHFKNILNSPKPIIVEHDVWIGSRCTILKGAIVPYGSVLASSSVLSKKLSTPHCVYGGNPVSVLKSNISWEI